jgi:RNA polymerase sigma factor (sigma-70 family)
MSHLKINITEIFSRIDYHTSIAVKRRLIRQQDIDDVQQDIIVSVFRRVKDFDPCRAAWSTFLNTIIESEIRQFLLRKCWLKHREFVSVHDLEENEQPLTNFYPTYELNEIEYFVFLNEIRNVIKKLPNELREICQLLQCDAKIEVAQYLKIKKSVLSKKINQIAVVLSESKIIQDFFEKF